jgi:hypothetical protein
MHPTQPSAQEVAREKEEQEAKDVGKYRVSSSLNLPMATTESFDGSKREEFRESMAEVLGGGLTASNIRIMRVEITRRRRRLEEAVRAAGGIVVFFDVVVERQISESVVEAMQEPEFVAALAEKFVQRGVLEEAMSAEDMRLAAPVAKEAGSNAAAHSVGAVSGMEGGSNGVGGGRMLVGLILAGAAGGVIFAVSVRWQRRRAQQAMSMASMAAVPDAFQRNVLYDPNSNQEQDYDEDLPLVTKQRYGEAAASAQYARNSNNVL